MATAPTQSAALNSAQRAWLKKMGTALEAPVQSVGGNGAQASAGSVVAAPAAGDVKSLKIGDLPTELEILKEFLPEIKEFLKSILGRRSVVIEVVNKSTIDISRGKITAKDGMLTKEPPDVIKSGSRAQFVWSSAENDFLGSAIGEMDWLLTDSRWHIGWSHPRAGNVSGSSKIEGPLIIEPNESGDSFKYSTEDPIRTNAKVPLVKCTIFGGPPQQPKPVPPTPPPPGPTPSGQDVASSCILTVTNNTKFLLTLANSDHDRGRGNFMTLPPATIQPGSSASIVSVETPNSKEEGCKGFIEWQVGSPVPAVWRIEWDNPEGAQNDSKATITPQTAGFQTLDQIGQGEENVPVMFTLSGGGEGPPIPPGPVPPGPVPPGPVPPVPPGPESEFTDEEAKQPTLRKGDESADGWVETLQSLLIKHLGDSVGQEINGKFDQTTEKNVRKFQKDHKPKPLLVDGVVGNQTWAALRKAPPEAVGTDGRKPHTFVEKGPEARWACEKTDFGIIYNPKQDLMELAVLSVGDDRIDAFQAKVTVTPPGGKPIVLKLITIGPPTTVRDTGGGHVHKVKIPKFLTTFGPGTHVIEAQLPKQLGGDKFKDNFSVSAQVPTGGVVVTVTNAATSKPIAGATVQIQTVSSETSNSGLAVIDGIAPGKQPFQVIASGFQEARGTIEVTGDEDSADTLSVKLTPTQPPQPARKP